MLYLQDRRVQLGRTIRLAVQRANHLDPRPPVTMPGAESGHIIGNIAGRGPCKYEEETRT